MLYEEIKNGAMKHDDRISEDIVDLIWQFTYYPLPKEMNAALVKLQNECYGKKKKKRSNICPKKRRKSISRL